MLADRDVLGAQVMHELAGGGAQSVEHFGIRSDIGLPPPAGNEPGTLIQARIYAGDETVTVEDGQDIVAPAAQWFGFVDLPDIVIIKDVAEGFAVPEHAIEGAEKEHARSGQRSIKQVERAGKKVIGDLFFAYQDGS